MLLCRGWIHEYQGSFSPRKLCTPGWNITRCDYGSEFEKLECLNGFDRTLVLPILIVLDARTVIRVGLYFSAPLFTCTAG